MTEERIHRKFEARRLDPAAQARHQDCWTFVLEPRHDAAARAALLAYADACEEAHPLLASDIRERLRWETTSDRCAAAAAAAEPQGQGLSVKVGDRVEVIKDGEFSWSLEVKVGQTYPITHEKDLARLNWAGSEDYFRVIEQ